MPKLFDVNASFEEGHRKLALEGLRRIKITDLESCIEPLEHITQRRACWGSFKRNRNAAPEVTESGEPL